MRSIHADEITKAVKEGCISANRYLPDDLTECIKSCSQLESNPLAKSIFGDMLENLDAAKQMQLPVCQDTGMAVVFAEIGQEVCITGGCFEEAVNAGVAQGYIDGRLRCSVVSDPLFGRKNTGDNTPAVIHTRIVPGNTIKLTVAPKGFGSENMSRAYMLTPSATREDIIASVCDAAVRAAGNPCPPMVLGVGIGGDFEYCALLAKKALCRPVSLRNENENYRRLEEDMLSAVNKTGIGAQGFGGEITALAVNIEYYPTHIAGLPVAVNVGCHVTRHFTVEL